jgi:hypothetical protein
MFSGIFSSISLYIILGLAASTASLGWLSVHNYRAKVEAESALVVAINVNTDMQKSLNLKELSCKTDDASVVELNASNIFVQEYSDAISTDLQSYSSAKKTSVQATVQRTKEKPNNETIYLPDDGLLSPTILGLLHKSFCSAEPTDASCVSTGQLVN